jgi:hypothetical protein
LLNIPEAWVQHDALSMVWSALDRGLVQAVDPSRA